MDGIRAVAKQMLASTWGFGEADGTVALREVALIEAVRELERASAPPPLPGAEHTAQQVSRAP